MRNERTVLNILLLEDFLASAFTIIFDILNTAIREASSGDFPEVKIRLITPFGNNAQNPHGFEIPVSTSLENFECNEGDWLIIPGIENENSEQWLQKPESVKVLEFFRSPGFNKLIVCTACTSVCLLAKSGRLNGLEATTTWWLADKFSKEFPDVHLKIDKTVCVAEKIITAGATFSHADLALFIVSRVFSHDLAELISQMFNITIRNSQGKFYQLGIPNYTDPMIASAERRIRENLDKPYSMNDLAEEMNMSVKTLQRKFLRITGQTPKSFQRKIRLDQAIVEFRKGGLNISEIALKVGYQNPKELRKILREKLNKTPSELFMENI